MSFYDDEEIVGVEIVMLSDDGEVVKRYSPSDESLPWWVGDFGRGDSENNYSGNNSNNSHSVSVKLDRKPENVEELKSRLEKEKSSNREKQEKEKAYMDNVVAECNKKIDEFRQKINSHINNLQNEIDNQVDELKKEKVSAESHLSGLGFFDFSEKNKTKARIKELSYKISYLTNPNSAEREKNAIEEKLDNAFAEYKKSVNDYLDLRFPGRVMKNRLEPKWRIFMVLINAEEELTVTDIQRIIETEDKTEMSNQKISALLRQMIEEGIVKKITKSRAAYFSLNCDKEYAMVLIDANMDSSKYRHNNEMHDTPCPVALEISDIL